MLLVGMMMVVVVVGVNCSHFRFSSSAMRAIWVSFKLLSSYLVPVNDLQKDRYTFFENQGLGTAAMRVLDLNRQAL